MHYSILVWEISICLSCISAQPGLASNPIELLNYSAMNPWFNMFPFGMLPPNAMFNPVLSSPSVGSVAAKAQSASSLASPPLQLKSPTLENNAIVSRQHSVPPTSQSQVQWNTLKATGYCLPDCYIG